MFLRNMYLSSVGLKCVAYLLKANAARKYRSGGSPSRASSGHLAAIRGVLLAGTVDLRFHDQLDDSLICSSQMHKLRERPIARRESLSVWELLCSTDVLWA